MPLGVLLSIWGLGFGVHKTNLLWIIVRSQYSFTNTGPKMDVGEMLQIANNLVHLDMDVAQNQLAIAMNQRRKARRRRRWWMQPRLQRRTLYGQYERMMSELEVENPAAFKNFVWVEPAIFRELLNRLWPAIGKQDTFYRKALHLGLRLAIMFMFLATGDSYHSLMYGFRVAHNTISSIVH